MTRVDVDINTKADETLFLNAENIGVDYKTGVSCLTAIDDLSMRLNRKEIVTIVGPSGCGKTTFLRVLAGLLVPSRGKIKIENLSPVQYRNSRGIGFAFQRPILFPWRTVLQNMLLPAEINVQAVDADNFDEVEKMARDLLVLVGLSGFETAYPRQLSGGMLQRAALARAMLTRARLLLLDEPFSAVDDLTREQLWLDFSAIWRDQGFSALLVTHNIREAAFLSHRVFIMSRRPGRLTHEFDTRCGDNKDIDIISSPKFAEMCGEIKSNIV